MSFWRNLLLLICLGNFFGFLVGMVIYYQQMVDFSPLVWIFIPDCPVYVILAVAAYLGIVNGKGFRFLISIGLMKYGLWTLFVLFSNPAYFLTDLLGWVLVVEHIGMTAQFILLAYDVDMKWILAGLGWYILNDFMDYFVGTYPYMPDSGVFAAMVFAVSCSIVLPLFVKWTGARIEKNKQIMDIRKEMRID